MITHMHIENFKCFKDFDIDLGPFTVLIGPNDSGKTAFLQAIRLLCAVNPGQLKVARELAGDLGISLGRETVWRGDPSATITIRAEVESANGSAPQGAISIASCFQADRSLWFDCRTALATRQTDTTGAENITAEMLSRALGRPGYYCFSASALRKPSLPETKMLPDGTGFPTFLADFILADRDSFQKLEKAFYDRFPDYSGIRVVSPKGIYSLEFTTSRGGVLPADAVSDGALLSLAFLSLSFLPEPPTIMLVEEPENGVHHTKLEEIVTNLRALTPETAGVEDEDRRERTGPGQVVLTTHSPYLLDYAEPEEVRVFAKDREGAVHARKLSDYPNVESVKKHFRTGEIWSSLTEQRFVLGKGAGD